MSNVLDPWSLHAAPLRILSNDHCQSTATGFFWRERNETFLITNWHVVAGRDPDTREAFSFFPPQEIEYPRLIEGESWAHVSWQKLKLCDENDAPTYFQHPVYRHKADVAAVPVPLTLPIETIKGQQNSYVSPLDADSYHGDWSGRRLEMGSDLFVLGFPLGLKPTGHFPIWKRASVATEMDLLLEGKPAFLIDTATREGMSGSPVVHVQTNVTSPLGGSARHRSVEFVGVYSGRHVGHNEFEAQLGIVWKPEIIRDILAVRMLGTPDSDTTPASD